MDYKLLLTAIFSLTLFCVASAQTQSGQSSNFLAAENAWKNDKITSYQQLKSGLSSYPLFVYLEFNELKSKLSDASEHEIRAFIAQYGDTAPGHRIRAYYLDKLGSAGRWSDFLDIYHSAVSDLTELRCHHLNALIKSGNGNKTHDAVNALWLTPSSRPNSCNPVFEYWKSKNLLTRDLIWQRIEIAIQHGQPKLAKGLRGYLDNNDHRWLDHFIALRNNPEKTLMMLKGQHDYKGSMIGYGLSRLAEENLDKAFSIHSQVTDDLSENQRCDADERFGQAIQRLEDDRVYHFFKSNSDCPENPELHAARIRAALLRLAWNDVIDRYKGAPINIRNNQGWQYWHARALAETGNDSAANTLFTEIAKDRSMYAYLAADQLSDKYYWKHRPAIKETHSLEEMKSNPAMQRIRELYHLGRDLDGRREWNYLMHGLNQDQMLAVAVLLDQWGIHDRAIFTISKAAYWDDLEIRFPQKHQQLIKSYAKRRAIDANWAMAILRQESAFMADAKSGAGALGLMQLMPRTARHVAKQINMKEPATDIILEAENNIALGTAYLMEMMQKFGNITMATAAYNAGPHRVNSWLYDKPLPGDIWIELIPFKETRDYVGRVLTYAAIYDRLLGGEKQKISDRAGIIPTRAVR